MYQTRLKGGFCKMPIEEGAVQVKTINERNIVSNFFKTGEITLYECVGGVQPHQFNKPKLSNVKKTLKFLDSDNTQNMDKLKYEAHKDDNGCTTFVSERNEFGYKYHY